MEKKLIKLRMKVNELYFKQQLSKNMITKRERINKKFVIKWTKFKDQDFIEDNHG